MIEAAQDPKLLNTLKGHKDQINAVHFHPKGYNRSYAAIKSFQDQMIAWFSCGTSTLTAMSTSISDTK